MIPSAARTPTVEQATNRQRKIEPLHRWYPFAESYSPEFVRTILDAAMPLAGRIIDPFSGVGTTPITAAERGLTGFYCEVNPLLQFLTEAKLAVLSIRPERRARIVRELLSLADSLPSALSTVPPDRYLADMHKAVFGRSVFFSPGVFDQVLRLRSYVDLVACRDPLLASLIAIGVVCVLVQSSLVVRAGDLRFRRPDELRRHDPNVLEALAGQLRCMADDVGTVEGIRGKAILIAEDAKNLLRIPSLELSGVITSPPYLNGTNYFRNTKLELWFLRCLRVADDLYRFRRRAVTAGINDVSNGKAEAAESFSFDPLKPVLSTLEDAAYDRRIPLMVKLYFSEIDSVFDALRHHLTVGAQVVVDIGDSIYAGVHVPTDRIIADMLEARGYMLQSDTTLRQRYSRNGKHLRQCLLTFQYKRASTKQPALPRVPAAWDRFKIELPHHQAPYAKRNWGHPIHSLCSYAGKMKPSLAAHLVQTFVPPRGRMLDPFAGSGTIPLEGVLRGCTSYALEISPLAVALTSAKIGRPTRQECEDILSELEAWIADYRPSADDRRRAAALGYNGKLGEYYHDQTFGEVLSARAFFSGRHFHEPSTALVLSSLLHILHGNRPYALSRRSHPITPFAPSGEFEYRPLMPSLRTKVERSLSALEAEPPHGEGHTFFQDATKWWPSEIENLDAIITSPPFFDSTRFYLANWIRLWFCGWEPEDFEAKPLSFVDELQKKTFDIYEPVLRQTRERLKPGGRVVFHLGRSRKCDMAQKLATVAAPWFRILDHCVEDVTHCESHGIRDKGTVEAHQYLVLG